MSPPVLLHGLSEIAADYDAILCDVWGVIHNGREAFPAACDALQRYRKERGPVVLISNAPRPSTALYGQIGGLGVPEDAWSAYVTSGDVTRALLSERAPGPAWFVGPERDLSLFEGLDLAFAEGPQDAAFIACTSPFDDEHDQPEDYRARFQACAKRGLEMVCANPDRMVQKGDRLIYCAGALADVYESLGGRVTMGGKPHEPIYRCATDEVAVLLGRNPDRSRILCIGDGVSTDVLGAQRQALDCLFLWGGVHAADLSEGTEALAAERAAALLATHSTLARYAMPALVW
ncbi:MAG: TIGR01459 family HAD-type hydrolase [Caulobacteraceae bacterium]